MTATELSKSEHQDDSWHRRVPEAEAMNLQDENAAYDRIASRWLEKAVYPRVIKLIDSANVHKILDVGSGSGRMAMALARWRPAASVEGIELSESMLALARANAATEVLSSRLKFHRGDASSMPFAADSFDAAVSYGSLHHWRDPQAVFAELCRVVRPEGQIVISDWRRDPLFLPFFESQRGSLEFDLIEASIRAAYRAEEVKQMLEPLESLCQWRVTEHALGLAICGRVNAG